MFILLFGIWLRGAQEAEGSLQGKRYPQLCPPGVGRGNGRCAGRTAAPGSAPKPPPSAPSFQPSSMGKPCGASLAAPTQDIYSWKAALLPLPKHEGDLETARETSLFRKGFFQSGGTALSKTPGGLRALSYGLRTAPGHTKAASFTQPSLNSMILHTAIISRAEITANPQVPLNKRRESSSQPWKWLPDKPPYHFPTATRASGDLGRTW